MAELDRMAAEAQLEERFEEVLPSEKDYPEWIVFKLGASNNMLQLAEVGQVRAADGNLAIMALAERHPGSDGGRFVAFRPSEIRGVKVRLTHVAHLED